MTCNYPCIFQDYDSEDMSFLKSAILDKWDLNHDGKINKSELSMLLLQQGRMAAQEAGVNFDEESATALDSD